MADSGDSAKRGWEETFADPPASFRGKPFWALNGPLQETELRRQIRVFGRMGLGGAFLHSRVGLATPYLSKRWFRLMRAAADECRKRGMEAWLYDEDRWPSGAAGGFVTREPAHRMRALEMNVSACGLFSPKGDEMAFFLASLDGREAKGVKCVSLDEARRAGSGVVLTFREVVNSPSPWYNDQTYLDTLSREAVGRFIEVTHKAYAGNMRKYFGKIVPGIFTDEPNYFQPQGAGWVPWTGKLPSIFSERYGYDLLGRLPELFLRVEGEDFSKVRRDFRDCLTHLFVDSFARQIGEWCERNGLAFTGHVLEEESLLSQTREVGAAMRFYEFMQAPGIDILMGQILKRPGGRPPEYLTAKQCASQLRQCGRKWMLSELYGCTGWQFTFLEHKAVGDWQAALGVNLRCPHLSFYTMRGEAKRDYPASISFQSPWWEEYPMVEDYFARVGVLLTKGVPVRDVAVVHPIESAWGVITKGPNPAQECVEGGLERVQDTLLSQHFDFDYVDEDFLARRGRASEGKLLAGEADYRAVVVPPVFTLRASTLGLLAEVLKSGGQVVFVGDPPERVDGVPSPAARELAGRAQTARGPEEVPALLLGAKEKIRRVSVKKPDGAEFADCLYMLREEAETGKTVVFLCNTRQAEASGPLTVRIPASGQAQEWDPHSGKVFLAEGRELSGETEIQTDLAGAGSRLFVVESRNRPVLARRPRLKECRREALHGGPWRIRMHECNAFPLDVAAFSIGGKWREPLEVLRIDSAVRAQLGIRPRGGWMVQPWAQKEEGGGKTVPVALRFKFRVESPPAGPCHLVMEEPSAFRVSLNGRRISARRDAGWWIDPSFRRIPLPAKSIKRGQNELLIRTDYGRRSGLEAMYLTGPFGVRWEGRQAVIGPEPEKLELGDWRDQGLACYSGAVSYLTLVSPQLSAGQRAFLELPRWEGTLVKVAVNGRPAGRLAWPPFELDLTDCLRRGDNELDIQVVSSRRNLLGPLHNSEVYPGWTGPAQFVDAARWTDDYVSVPYGLMETPVLSLREPE